MKDSTIVLPKISIIVPIFNAEHTLKRCVDSILNQSYENIECILINDGSTDNSLVLCNEYMKNDSRVVVLNQSNLGVSEARNNGLRIATGEWIGFVDSDDQIDSNMYSLLINNAISYSVLISVCGFMVISKEIAISLIDSVQTSKVKAKKAIKLIKRKRYIEGGPWNKLFHKSVVNDLNFLKDIHFGEDTLFLVDAFSKVKDIVISTAPCYMYYNNSSSLSKNINRSIVDYAYIMFENSKNKSLFYKMYSKATVCYIEYIYAMNNQIRVKTNKRYLIYCVLSGGFPISNIMAICLYLISPHIYFHMKRRIS